VFGCFSTDLSNYACVTVMDVELWLSLAVMERFMDWNGLGRERPCPNLHTIPASVWRDWRKPSFKVTDGPAEIRTEHLPNRNLQRYRYTNALHIDFTYSDCIVYNDMVINWEVCRRIWSWPNLMYFLGMSEGNVGEDNRWLYLKPRLTEYEMGNTLARTRRSVRI
jgi:hypothetical protein